MNTMADNIGGSTMHSFARIPFKDRRGMLIQTGKGTTDPGSWPKDDEWAELRFLLFDEVEAAGVHLFGTVEEHVRRKVPSRDSAVEALRKAQHPHRKRDIAFAGVNVLCFGDFWQLDPTGDVAFASNPLKCIGIPDVDRTMTMF